MIMARLGSFSVGNLIYHHNMSQVHTSDGSLQYCEFNRVSDRILTMAKPESFREE